MIFLRTVFFLTLSGLAMKPSQVLGRDCTPVDLRSQLGPARDQGITMWCYAHSAAELVTQKLQTRVSAFDLAASYLLNDERKISNNKNSAVQKALRQDPRFFARLKEWRLDEPSSYSARKILTDRGFYYLGGYEQDAILLSAEDGYCADKNLPGGALLFERHLKDLQACARSHCGRSGFQKCGFPAPIKMGEIQSPNSRALASLFKIWVNRKCGPRLKPASPLVAASVDAAEDLDDYNKKLLRGELQRTQVLSLLFKEIDSKLEQGKAVSIGYDLLDVSPPDQVLVRTGESAAIDQSDHSSVIAARKKINGICHYFVRTHMGFSCPYLPQFKGFCEPREGGLWVKPSDIRSLYTVVHIQN